MLPSMENFRPTRPSPHCYGKGQLALKTGTVFTSAVAAEKRSTFAPNEMSKIAATAIAGARNFEPNIPIAIPYRRSCAALSAFARSIAFSISKCVSVNFSLVALSHALHMREGNRRKSLGM